MLQLTTLQLTTTATTGSAAPWGRLGGEAGFAAQARRMRMAIDVVEPTDGPASDTAERRRGLRVRQVRPVKMLDMGAGRTVAGQTLDVSTTGLRLAVPSGSGLRVGDVLGVHVGLSRIGERLANRRQMIPVRVVWVEHGGAGGQGQPPQVTVGVEFTTGIGAQRDAA